jgi:SAM-dependent methyltransferase
LGDDADLLAARGFRVTAFDVSPTAVAWCRQRFPASHVRYETADLLNPPAEWSGAFDFVFEAYTLQVFKAVETRTQAANRLAAFPRPGGTLLVLCRGREPSDPEGQMPWPLLRDELSVLETCGLKEIRFEDFADRHETPAVRRFRALYRRPSSAS